MGGPPSRILSTRTRRSKLETKLSIRVFSNPSPSAKALDYPRLYTIIDLRVVPGSALRCSERFLRSQIFVQLGDVGVSVDVFLIGSDMLSPLIFKRSFGPGSPSSVNLGVQRKT